MAFNTIDRVYKITTKSFKSLIKILRDISLRHTILINLDIIHGLYSR